MLKATRDSMVSILPQVESNVPLWLMQTPQGRPLSTIQLHALSLSNLLTLLQLCWLPFCSSNMPSLFLLHGLCTYCLFCLVDSTWSALLFPSKLGFSYINHLFGDAFHGHLVLNCNEPSTHTLWPAIPYALSLL